MEFVQISEEEKAARALIEPTYLNFIEQKPEEADFLYALASRSNATKAIELGVSTGASSAMLAHIFLKENSNTQFFSIDYSEDWYINPAHKSGFVMNVYPNVNKRWGLCTGGVAANFMEIIGNEIDFVFLDTSHEMPCEILDFLMILPYLKEDCTMVVHDVNLQTAHPLESLYTVNNMLMSTISGEKLLPEYVKDFYAKNTQGELLNARNLMLSSAGRFNEKEAIDSGSRLSVFTYPNIAAVRLNKYTRENIWDLFNALLQPWQYVPSEEDYAIILSHFKKHYEPFLCTIFENAYHLAKYGETIREVIKANPSILENNTL